MSIPIQTKINILAALVSMCAFILVEYEEWHTKNFKLRFFLHLINRALIIVAALI